MVSNPIQAQMPMRPPVTATPVEKWVNATGQAPGEGEAAIKEATQNALRKAIEESCGVFLTSQSRTKDFKAVYDRVFTNTVGYVREYNVTKTTSAGGETRVTVRALVSTRRFEEDWAAIAHTLDQEGNPRMLVAIAEMVQQRGLWDAAAYEVNESGIVQGKVEDFMLSRGITLVDRTTAAGVNKRDVLLAAVKDEPAEVAALAARFNAEVVVTGRATVKYGNAVEVAGQTLHQYVASMTVRVIQTDSARILASKSFGPVTSTSMQRTGGEDKALAKLGEDSAPRILAAIVDAWRQRQNVSRTVTLSIRGMDYAGWKTFQMEASRISGVQSLRLREIVEGMAHVDVESEFDYQAIADKLCALIYTRLAVEEITPNRLKLYVVTAAGAMPPAPAPAPTPAPMPVPVPTPPPPAPLPAQ